MWHYIFSFFGINYFCTFQHIEKCWQVYLLRADLCFITLSITVSSLWFMILPAYIKYTQSVMKALVLGYDIMKDMQTHKLKPPDEVQPRDMTSLTNLLYSALE